MATTPKTAKSPKKPAAPKKAAKATKTAKATAAAKPALLRPSKKALTCPTVERQWHLIDCTDQTLGRLAVRISNLLRGKHRPQYTPHLDNGDFVVAINVEKLKLTGRKLDQKTYWRHSGHMGGIKSATARDLMATKPGDILSFAVKGMLPQNALSRKLLTKLKVFAGSAHPHTAQFATPAVAA